MRGGKAQNYPSYDDRHKQEAARFLGAGPENLRPMLRGMISFERLDAWTEVAKEMDVDETERRMLRKHRVRLNERNNVDVDFAPEYDDLGVDEDPEETVDEPSVDAESEPAVADGGSVVEEVDEEDEAEESDDEWEPRDGQDVLEYETDEEFQSELRSARGLAEHYDEIDEVEEALEREQQRDEWRPHVAQALMERLEVLGQ